MDIIGIPGINRDIITAMSAFFTSTSHCETLLIFSVLAHCHFYPFSCRRILAPGEEENLEFEEDEEEGGAGAGSPDSYPARVPGRCLFLKIGIA